MSTPTESGGRPIADYALLSDCHSSALVSSEGSIDWACLRRFDGPSTFAHLLDPERGGRAFVEVDGEVVERRRRYRPGTMILETELVTPDATLRITDAFAMRRGGARDPHHQLIRRVEAVDGPIRCRLVVEPRFDYGAARPWLRSHSPQRVSAIAAEDAVLLDADVELVIDRSCDRVVADLELAPGATGSLVMSARAAHLRQPGRAPVPDADALLDETTAWWHRWSSATCVEGEFAELLERSALVLKSLCCAPTGGIVAAPTTSLPEIPGGAANWDYRYCWVRDATLTLEALAAVGHPEVAQGFRDFIMRSSAGHGDELQIMYGPYGARRLPEIELDLAGWRGARPVRIGNAAAGQTQLDVYGHLLDAAHVWHGRDGSIDDDEWRFLSSVVDEAMAAADRPDSGIWELRDRPRHYVHSKVMIWVALDRGIRLVEDAGLSGEHSEVDDWRRARDEIRREIDERGVHDGHYVTHYDSDDVDASLLKLPLVGFVDADDPRMVATVDAIMRDLAVPPAGLLRRFRGDHDAGSTHGTEGVFLLCSFWLVEVLALQGRTDDARELFDRLAERANDLGLFAEEYDPDADEMLGNFPQAFTHLGLISAAVRLGLVPDAGGTQPAD